MPPNSKYVRILHRIASPCSIAYHASMKRTLRALNRMIRDGVIEGYVIGGAVGAAYYLEPVTTQDLDVFVQLKTSKSGLLHCHHFTPT